MLQIPKSTPLLALNAVVLDTETTGLDARKARIIQIGAVRVEQGRLADAPVLDRLVDPGEAIPPTTTAVHGITDEMVVGAPTFAEVAAELEDFAQGALLVGHTIRYDLDMLRREYALCARAFPAWRALDIAMLARIAAPSLANHGLDALCTWLGIENERRHSALGDARATAQTFIALLPLLRARNIRTLGEAEQACLALAEADARATGGLAQVGDVASAEAAPIARIDSFPYRHRVREIMSAPAVTVDGGMPLERAMALLIERKISSVLVTLRSGEMGILTERDALRAIVAQGPQALACEVEGYASKPLQVVDEEAFVYRAIGRLERLGFRHLGVRGRDGAISGVVTTRNLLRNRSTTAIVLGDEIDAAADAAGLAAAWAKIPVMARGLMEEAVDPWIIAAVVSSEIRNMTRRSAQLAERRLAAEGAGPPPVPYCVLVLGSAGRGESQLAADQDNAIVYADGSDAAATDADAWFERMATIMNETLDAAGIPLCKGGVMARNAAWRMSVRRWRETIDGWVTRQRPQDLLNVDIFFDAAAVYGDTGLADEIWSHAYDRGHRATDFIKLLTETTRRRGQAFTMFGGFRVDEKGRFDLKKHGLMPIFTAARVLSIRHDVRMRSTPDRLHGVAALGIGSPELVKSVLDAQALMLGTVIDQQLGDLQTGIPLSPAIVPSRLDKEKRGQLKQALAAVDEILGLVSEGRF